MNGTQVDMDGKKPLKRRGLNAFKREKNHLQLRLFNGMMLKHEEKAFSLHQPRGRASAVFVVL